MKNPMDDSRTPRSESGFALIEVIVAAAVLAIVALAVLSGIDAAGNTSAREKGRAVAASLAEQDQERLRAMTYEQINKKPNVDQQPDVTVDGVTYKIQSNVDLVTDDIGGTPECGAEGTEVTYVHITSTVTSVGGLVGTKIPPVEVDSLIPPTQKWAEGHGTLGVKVVDRSATKGVRNISVSATSTAYTPPSASTDENGCAVFKDVPVGTYTVTLNTLNYIDRDANQLSQATANVVAKKVVFATMSYDVADTATVRVVTHAPGRTWAASNSATPSQVQASKARQVSTMNGAKVGFVKTYTPGSPATTVTADGLFPFAENSYTFFTGSCRYQAPDKVTQGTNTSPLYPNYFTTGTGGVNSAAAVLLDPAIVTQTADVRQPPLNLRIASSRNNGSFAEGDMVVVATLVKPSAYSTDTCSEPKFTLTTKAWDSRFGTNPASNTTHWVSQTGSTYDPGLPFGEYTFCLRDTVRGYGANIPAGTLTYNNELPDGQTSTTSINGNSLTWATGTTC
jgi:prepilin-type N-terminal cleavage/methylation domain-containing protein